MSSKALFACALAAVVAAAACREAQDERPYQVVAARRQTLAISAEAAGVLEPVRTVEVKSKASGEILAIPVETGDVVKEGDLLVQVEQKDARQTLAQAQADLDVAHARLRIAESQLERSRRMEETGVITEQDLETAELEHANAKAALVRGQSNLEIARERMAETTIRAPIAGTIIARTVEVGQVISSATQVVGGGTLLMTMADLVEVQVRTLVDETDIARVQPELPADISVEAFRDRTFRGRVLKIEPQATVQQNVTMFPVIIRIDNREGLLKPGMSAEVTIQVAHAENAVTVPAQAVHPTDDAREVARLALGIESDAFEAILARSAPQEAAASGGPDAAGTDGQGPQRLTQAQRDSLRQRFTSGQMTPQEMQQMRERFERFRQGQEQGRQSEVTSGVVFVLRDGQLQPVPVRLGVTDWENIEIISGIQEGDSVALLPTASLLRDQSEMQQRFRPPSGVPGMQRQGGTGR
jgi:HlyD family secretion protein